MTQIVGHEHQKSLFVYFLLTFAFSWGIWIPMAVLRLESPWYKFGAFAPTIMALVLIWIQKGGQGIKNILQKLLIWRVSIGWYLFSFFAALPIVLLSIWIHVRLGGTKPAFNDLSQIYLAIPAFLYVLFTSVLGEEIGWRGYALPRLLQGYNALKSSLILGLIWGVWHLPLFWLAGNFHNEVPFLPFMIQVLAASIVYTWMFVNTEGSLLFPHLFHAASNTTLGVLPILPMDTGGALRPMWTAVVLWSLVSILITILTGPDLKNTNQKRPGVSTK